MTKQFIPRYSSDASDSYADFDTSIIEIRHFYAMLLTFKGKKSIFKSLEQSLAAIRTNTEVARYSETKHASFGILARRKLLPNFL